MPAIVVELMTWLGIGTVATTGASLIGGTKSAVSGMSNGMKYAAIAVGAIVLIKLLK